MESNIAQGTNEIAAIELLKSKLIEIICNNDIESFHTFHYDTQYSYIERADYSITELLLTSRYSSFRSDVLPTDNLSLIHVAAFADSLEIFCTLIEKYGFNINTRSIDSYLPFHYAALYGSSEILRYILFIMPALSNYGNNILNLMFF